MISLIWNKQKEEGFRHTINLISSVAFKIRLVKAQSAIKTGLLWPARSYLVFSIKNSALTLSWRSLLLFFSSSTSPARTWNSAFFLRRHFLADFLFWRSLSSWCKCEIRFWNFELRWAVVDVSTAQLTFVHVASQNRHLLHPRRALARDCRTFRSQSPLPCCSSTLARLSFSRRPSVT